MSYILTALNKAERDRVAAEPQGASVEPVMSPQPLTCPGVAAPGSTKARHRTALIICLTLVTAGLGFGLAHRSDTEPRHLPEQPTGPETVRRSAPGGTPVIENRQTSGLTANTLPAAADPESMPGARTGVPEHIAPEPPALNITGYIFFEHNPTSSKVFIEGLVYGLDAEVSPGLRIVRFDAGGFVLASEQGQYRIPAP